MTEITRVKISVGQVSYEVEGSEEFVRTELKWFKETVLGKVKIKEHLLPPEGEEKTRPEPSPEKRPPAKVFMEEKAPKTDPEAAAVMAYYLEKWKDISVVNGDLIAEWFRKGGRRPPKTPKQTLVDAKAKGFFNKAKGKGNYTLSNAGRYLVEHDLPRSSD